MCQGDLARALKAEAELDRLRAENERLRTALSKAAEEWPPSIRARLTDQPKEIEG